MRTADEAGQAFDAAALALCRRLISVMDLVLVAEPGSASIYVPFGETLKLNYTWSLHLHPYRDNVWIERKPGEQDKSFRERLEQERARSPEFGATVTVHCSGPIDQAALELPLRFRTSVGGRLKRLADFHNERRERLTAEGNSTVSQPRTCQLQRHRGQALAAEPTQGRPRATAISRVPWKTSLAWEAPNL